MLKKNVLRGNKDFNSVYKKGKSVGDKYIVLFYKRNNLTYNRIAFLASKKVGNSVARSRAVRLMRESYRQINNDLSVGYDIIFIARNTINNRKCQDVLKSMKSAVRRSEIKKKWKEF